jgi:methyl-accepting chemotaxis protein
MNLLTPVRYGKDGPLFDSGNIMKMALNDINNGINYFKRRSKKMTTEVEEANTMINNSVDNLSKNIDRLNDKESEFISNAKRISTGIRKNSESLATGIGRIKSAASLDELEKYTLILERFTGALEKLELIQQQGKLDKITQALK